MLGRTAASLYWTSRYNERAENMARLLEVGYLRSYDSRMGSAHMSVTCSYHRVVPNGSDYFRNVPRAIPAGSRRVHALECASRTSLEGCRMQGRLVGQGCSASCVVVSTKYRVLSSK